MRFPLSVLTIETRKGRVANGVDFEVQELDATPVTVYDDDVGGTPIASPASDTNGHPEGYVDGPAYYVLHSPDGEFVDQVFLALTPEDLGGRYIVSARRETSFNTTTAAPGDDVTDLVGTVPADEVTGKPLVIEFSGNGTFNTTAGQGTSVMIYDDLAEVELASVSPTSSTANAVQNPYCRALVAAPTPGVAQQFKVKLARSASGTAWLFATASRPMLLTVREG